MKFDISDVVNRTVSKIIITILIFFILFLLLAWHYFIFNVGPTLNIFLQIFGGFLATLFGVYISLHLSSQEELKRQGKINENILIGVLKLINSELCYNNTVFDLLLKMLNKNYKHSMLIVEDNKDVILLLKNIKDKSYYSTIASGDFKEISKNLNLLNLITNAYDNISLTINTLNLSAKYLEDFYSENKKETKEKFLEIIKQHNANIRRIKTQISLNKDAIKEIEKVLDNYGIYYESEFIQGNKI